VPAIATAAATDASPKASTEDAFQKIVNAIDKARKTQFRNEPISLIITRTGANLNPQSTTGRVDLYRAINFWNQSASKGQAIYAYNYYVNTVSCFAHNRYGTWRPAYQNNGYWFYPSLINSGAAGAMQATGYDNRKGCYWQGRASYNKGDFFIYIYN
jgi:hypothetical protein